MYIKKNTLIWIITISVIVLFAVFFGVAQSPLSGGQAVPNYLNYQGRLIDPSTEQPIPDGNHNVTFYIYDAETGGSLKGGPYTSNVTTQNGLFNTLIGQVDPSVFDGSDRWVEIEVDGETISTRQRIVSVAYAIRATSAADADTLGGKSPSEFVTNPFDGNFTVSNGSVLFAGTTGATPTSGAGARMMWIPEKKAFRAGEVFGDQWDADNIGNWSFAVVSNAQASGDCSIAMGSGTASGYGSIAIGLGTKASGQGSIAIGWETTASGWYSTAMGQKTTASVQYSTAMGNYSKASGTVSTAMGFNTEASGDFSVAMGYESKTSGSTSIAMGSGTMASGDGSIAMGVGTTASGNYSTAMGKNASTNDKKGSFVYGDDSPSAVGDVKATADNQFMVRAAGGYVFYTNSATTLGAKLDPGATSWTVISDRHKKENFKSIDGEKVLKFIREMPITSWNYKDDEKKSRHYGPMAQDFYAAFGLGSDALGITTQDISGVNMVAIQALEKRTAELKEVTAQLKAKDAELEAKISELEMVKAELAEVKAKNEQLQRNQELLNAKMVQLESALRKLEALTATRETFDGSGTSKITKLGGH